MRRLDPTFDRSPGLAIQAPVEGLAYVATCQVNGQPDAIWVVDLAPHSPSYGHVIDAVSSPMSAMSSIISVGMRAVRPYPPLRRLHSWSDATWWWQVCVPRGSTSSTPSPILANLVFSKPWLPRS